MSRQKTLCRDKISKGGVTTGCFFCHDPQGRFAHATER